jgi:hypothetical protein
LFSQALALAASNFFVVSEEVNRETGNEGEKQRRARREQNVINRLRTKIRPSTCARSFDRACNGASRVKIRFLRALRTEYSVKVMLMPKTYTPTDTPEKYTLCARFPLVRLTSSLGIAIEICRITHVTSFMNSI